MTAHEFADKNVGKTFYYTKERCSVILIGKEKSNAGSFVLTQKPIKEKTPHSFWAGGCLKPYYILFDGYEWSNQIIYIECNFRFLIPINELTDLIEKLEL